MNFDDLTFDAKILLDLNPEGWTKDPLHDLAKLTEETGEVAECMVKSIKTVEDLGEELSDVLVVVAVLALRAGIDLNDVCPKKQQKRIQKLVDRFYDGKLPQRVRKDIAKHKRNK